MKKKHWFIGILFLVLLSVIIGWIWKHQTQEITTRISTRRSMLIKKEQWIHNGDWLLITWENTPNKKDKQVGETEYTESNNVGLSVITPKYILCIEDVTHDDITKIGGEGKRAKVVSLKISVYDQSKEKEKIKELDLFQLGKSKAADLPENVEFSTDKVLSKDGDYLQFYAFTRDNFEYEKPYERQIYYVNIDTEEVLTENEMDPLNIWLGDEGDKDVLTYEQLGTDHDTVSDAGLELVFRKRERLILVYPFHKKDQSVKSGLELKYPEVETILNSEYEGTLFFIKNPPDKTELQELLKVHQISEGTD